MPYLVLPDCKSLPMNLIDQQVQSLQKLPNSQKIGSNFKKWNKLLLSQK